MTCTIHTTHFKGCSFTLYEYTSYKPEATTCSCTNTAHVGLLLLATPPGLGVVIPAHVYMYIYILFYIYRYIYIYIYISIYFSFRCTETNVHLFICLFALLNCLFTSRIWHLKNRFYTIVLWYIPVRPMFDSFLDSQDCCALKRRTCFALFLENIGLQPKAHQAGKKSAVKSHGKKISCKSRQQIRLPVREALGTVKIKRFFWSMVSQKRFLKKKRRWRRRQEQRRQQRHHQQRQ